MLESLQLDQYVKSFKEATIDGPFLLELREEDIVQILGVKHKLHVRKILPNVKSLNHSVLKKLLKYEHWNMKLSLMKGGNTKASLIQRLCLVWYETVDLSVWKKRLMRDSMRC